MTVEDRILELEAALARGEKLYPDPAAEAQAYRKLAGRMAETAKGLLEYFKVQMLPAWAEQYRQELQGLIKEYEALSNDH